MLLPAGRTGAIAATQATVANRRPKTHVVVTLNACPRCFHPSRSNVDGSRGCSHGGIARAWPWSMGMTSSMGLPLSASSAELSALART